MAATINLKRTQEYHNPRYALVQLLMGNRTVRCLMKGTFWPLLIDAWQRPSDAILIPCLVITIKRTHSHWPPQERRTLDPSATSHALSYQPIYHLDIIPLHSRDNKPLRLILFRLI